MNLTIRAHVCVGAIQYGIEMLAPLMPKNSHVHYCRGVIDTVADCHIVHHTTAERLLERLSKIMADTPQQRRILAELLKQAQELEETTRDY